MSNYFNVHFRFLNSAFLNKICRCLIRRNKVWKLLDEYIGICVLLLIRNIRPGFVLIIFSKAKRLLFLKETLGLKLILITYIGFGNNKKSFTGFILPLSLAVKVVKVAVICK